MDYVRLGENIMKKDSICQVNIINQQNVTTAMNYLEKEKVQKSLRILTKFTDNKQINIIFYKIIYNFPLSSSVQDVFIG